MEAFVLFCVAAAVVAFGLLSRRAERSVLTPPMWFAVVGFGLSAYGLGVMGAPESSEGIRLLAEVALVLVLFTDAARIDLASLRREESLPARLLGAGLPLTILAGTTVGWFVFPGFGWIDAALLAAILAPTDAALGQAVVSNRIIPVRIRQSLNVESGLNDGIVLPVVLVAAALASAVEGDRGAVDWLGFVALQLTLGPLVGVAVGFVGGRAIDRAVRVRWMTDAFQRLSAIGLAVGAYAGAHLIGGNGFIAAFVAGLTIGNTARGTCSHLYEFGEAEGQLLTSIVFVVFGAVLVPASLPMLDWRAMMYAVLSLTVIRMAPVALVLAGTGLHRASLAFLGWFGPRGLASILFVLLIVDDQTLAEAGRIQSVVVLTVLLSTFAHGATAYPLTRRYAAWLSTMAEGAATAERADAHEMRPRIRHSGER